MTVTWAPGRLILDGAFNTGTDPSDLRATIDALHSAGTELIADCSRVTKVDDRGVAFLMGVAHFAGDRGVRIRLVDAPRTLRVRLRRARIEELFDW